MHSEFHGNVVHPSVELLLLVSILFLLAIPKSLLTLKEFLYTNDIITAVMATWRSAVWMMHDSEMA